MVGQFPPLDDRGGRQGHTRIAVPKAGAPTCEIKRGDTSECGGVENRSSFCQIRCLAYQCDAPAGLKTVLNLIQRPRADDTQQEGE